MDINGRSTLNRHVFIAVSLYDSLDDCDLRGVELLLREQRADPNFILPDQGFSPFHFAIGNDNIEFAEAVVKLFLKNGGNPNVRSSEGLTPVHVAAAWGRTSLVRILLAHGGDPLLEDDDGKDSVRYACDEGYWEISEIIYEFIQNNIPDNKLVTGEENCINNPIKGTSTTNTEPQPCVQPASSSSTLNGTRKSLSSQWPPRRTSIMPQKPSEPSKTAPPSQAQALSGIEGTQSTKIDKSSRVEEWLATHRGSGIAETSDVSCVESDVLAGRASTNESAASNNTSVGTFVTVSAWSVHRIDEAGVALLEERLDAKPAEKFASEPREGTPNDVIILETDSESCGTESLRQRLRALGISSGPITTTTKRVYRRRLAQERSLRTGASAEPETLPTATASFSPELTRCLQRSGWETLVSTGCALERRLSSDFTSMGGESAGGKTSFCYLLLDSRTTSNLPGRAAEIPMWTAFAIFARATFYVGKGKQARPFHHLFHAATLHRDVGNKKMTAKDKCILDIWQEGCGVVCLPVFHNTTGQEALTREAAMIDAFGVANLTNEKRGEYHGQVSGWPMRQRRMLGTYLLRQALMVFLAEGERHLRPWDLA